MRRWLALIFVFMMVNLSIAQTEVVGEVSGVWDAEGSPYIVVDSTWVPEDDTLRIEAGVRIEFMDDMGLYVFGSLIAEGTEEDAIVFQISPDAESSWMGIFLLNEANVTLDYVEISGVDIAFRLCEAAVLEIDHSDITPISGLVYSWRGGYRSQTRIYNTIARSLTANQFIDIMSGSIIIENSELIITASRYGILINALFSAIRLYGCNLRGRVVNFGGILEISGCDISSPTDSLRDILVSAYCGAEITDNTIRGCFNAGGSSVTLVGNHIFGRTWLSQIDRDSEIHDNSIGHEAGYYGLRISDSNLNIYNNSMRHLECHNSYRCSVTDCYLDRGASFRNLEYVDFTSNNGGSVGIDCCEHAMIYDNDFEHGIGVESSSDVDICYNIISSGYLIFYHSQVLLDHNTVKIREDDYEAIYISGTDSEVIIVNNIFIGDGDQCDMVFATPIDDIPDIRCNCFWNFDGGFIGNRGVEFEPGEGNIFDDPRIRRLEPFTPKLREDSPCIDAGDPDYPLDPDSTRTDMGRFFYYQERGIGDYSYEIPENFRIYQPYPNPFNSECNVILYLSVHQNVLSELYDTKGRRVLALPVQSLNAGRHIISLNIGSLPAGCYFLNIDTGVDQEVLKLTKVR